MKTSKNKANILQLIKLARASRMSFKVNLRMSGNQLTRVRRARPVGLVELVEEVCLNWKEIWTILRSSLILN